MNRDLILKAQKIVIKFGTNILTNDELIYLEKMFKEKGFINIWKKFMNIFSKAGLYQLEIQIIKMMQN